MALIYMPRVERAQALAQELTERWLKKYEGVMRICNYTVGQADADNTCLLYTSTSINHTIVPSR